MSYNQREAQKYGIALVSSPSDFDEASDAAFKKRMGKLIRRIEDSLDAGRKEDIPLPLKSMEFLGREINKAKSEVTRIYEAAGWEVLIRSAPLIESESRNNSSDYIWLTLIRYGDK